MREDIAGPQGASSRPMWETLEGMIREKAQEHLTAGVEKLASEGNWSRRAAFVS